MADPMQPITWPDGSSLDVQLREGNPVLVIRDRAKRYQQAWEFHVADARRLAVRLMTMVRAFDPEGAEYRRLVAEAEADLEAELKGSRP